MGVHISDIISQLTGSMSYFPLSANFSTSENSGKNFIKQIPFKLSVLKTKKSLTENMILLSRTNKLIRGATLIHGKIHALLQDTIISLMFNAHHNVTEYSGYTIPLTMPSAVHLPTCFSPNSQQRGFSVEASSVLSPPQRF